MRLIALFCAAALLGGCATHTQLEETAATTYLVTLPDDNYHFQFVVDIAHDTADCDPPIRLTSNQVPADLEITFYPCTGSAFNDRVRPLIARALATGKQWRLYRPVPHVNGKDVGRVLAIGTAHTVSGVVYMPAH